MHRTTSLLVVSLSVVVNGCGPVAAESAQLAVSPEAIYFPGVRDGEATSAPLSLYNLGEGSLEVRSVELGVTSGYSIRGPGLPCRLWPGESLKLEISYRPGAGTPSSNVVEIETDDPAQPRARVELVGLATAAVLAATPPTVDFGAVQSGTSLVRRVQLSNLGLAAARQLSLDWAQANSDFAARLEGSSQEGSSLAPGSVGELVLTYTPRGGNEDHALLRISWIEGTLLVPLSGIQDLRPPD